MGMSSKNAENAKVLSDSRAACAVFGGAATARLANSTTRLVITDTESSDRWMMLSSNSPESKLESDVLAKSRHSDSSSSQFAGVTLDASCSAMTVRANSTAKRRQVVERASVWDTWARWTMAGRATQ